MFNIPIDLFNSDYNVEYNRIDIPTIYMSYM